MKALGSLVTFVRRNSSTVVTLRHTYCDMKAWSRMFVVNVQSVSVHHLSWNVISWYTRTSEALPAVYVLKVSGINNTLWYTLRDVLLASVLVTCNVCISLCVSIARRIWNVSSAQVGRGRFSCPVISVVVAIPVMWPNCDEYSTYLTCRGGHMLRSTWVPLTSPLTYRLSLSYQDDWEQLHVRLSVCLFVCLSSNCHLVSWRQNAKNVIFSKTKQLRAMVFIDYHIARCCHLANSMSWSQTYMLHCRVLPPANLTACHPRATYPIHGSCRSLKVLENRHAPWKSLNLCLKGLESAWIWFLKTSDFQCKQRFREQDADGVLQEYLKFIDEV